MTKRTIYCILSALCLMPFTSCRTEGDTPEPNPDDWSAKSYLRINLILPQTTRAEATEDGLDMESRIHDLTVFIYKDESGNGVNNPPETKFAHRIYADMFRPAVDNSGVMTVDVELSDEYVHDPSHRVAVVANMGDRTELATLGDLQEYIHGKTWQESNPMCLPSGCSRFTMASSNAADGAVTESRAERNTGGVHYTAHVEVERTAARIDMLYSDSQIKEDKEYVEYTATANDGVAFIGNVRLYGISPINIKQLPSFALKRVSDGIGSDYTCFNSYHYTGGIQGETDTRPTAYVIEPHTVFKTADPTEDPAAWYGDTHAENLKHTQWEDDLNLKSLLGEDNINIGVVGGKAVVVTYANENTHHVSQQSDQWLTGVLLRALFVPGTVYTDGDATVPMTGYQAGDTFWCYRPADGNADELYFSSQEAAQAYLDAHPAAGAGIVEIPNGRCYYHAWIRHTVVEGEHWTFPMEYGIVRNHIYRLGFAFRRVGSPEPDIRDPENVDVEIFVRPWNAFRHGQIII